MMAVQWADGVAAWQRCKRPAESALSEAAVKARKLTKQKKTSDTSRLRSKASAKTIAINHHERTR